VITLDGVLADSTDDKYATYPATWRTLTSAQLSNGGKTITIKGLNEPLNYATAIAMYGNTVSSAGNYTISVVVDADGDGLLYEPSNPASITLKVQ